MIECDICYKELSFQKDDIYLSGTTDDDDYICCEHCNNKLKNKSDNINYYIMNNSDNTTYYIMNNCHYYINYNKDNINNNQDNKVLNSNK